MNTQTHQVRVDRGRRLSAHNPMIVAVLALLAAVLIVGAIWAMTPRDPVTPTSGTGSAGVMAGGPGISVSDALASTLDGPLLINGFLYVTAEGTVYLADALAESYPPSINRARSLEVRGIDPARLKGLNQAGGISWSDSSTQLAGSVDAGVLTVSDLIQAQ